MSIQDANAPRRVLWLIAGFTVWSIAFVALYAMLSVGCAFGWHLMPVAGPVTVQRIVLVALFALSIGAAVGTVVLARAASRAEPRGSPDLARIGMLAAWAALASSVVNFGPVFFLSACY